MKEKNNYGNRRKKMVGGRKDIEVSIIKSIFVIKFRDVGHRLTITNEASYHSTELPDDEWSIVYVRRRGEWFLL